jgi:hypothetical protein
MSYSQSSKCPYLQSPQSSKCPYLQSPQSSKCPYLQSGQISKCPYLYPLQSIQVQETHSNPVIQPVQYNSNNCQISVFYPYLYNVLGPHELFMINQLSRFCTYQDCKRYKHEARKFEYFLLKLNRKEKLKHESYMNKLNK